MSPASIHGPVLLSAENFQTEVRAVCVPCFDLQQATMPRARKLQLAYCSASR